VDCWNSEDKNEMPPNISLQPTPPAAARLSSMPLGGRPPQENAKDETHIACVLAGQPDFVGLRACVRANANTCAQRDTVAHRHANKHRHTDQHANSNTHRHADAHPHHSGWQPVRA
jgi:hypothetical protein